MGAEQKGFLIPVVAIERTTEPDGRRIVAHDYRGNPEIKVVTIVGGFKSFHAIPLDENGKALMEESEGDLLVLVSKIAGILQVDKSEAISSLRLHGEQGINYPDEPASRSDSV